ncbi:MAG: hypothetical protein HYZ27_06870, partial [Deltaproteobacteria bacterium]|nr:hypothetical protein [Deltaproteobacteria bacterium]
PVIARADAGEVALGPRLEVASPFAMRAAAAARLGVTDWAAVEAHAGGGLDESGAFARLGAVAGLDVFTWVPEVHVAFGLSAGSEQVRSLIELRLRGFFAAQGSLTFAGGVEWDGERSFVLGSLTVWLDLS